MSNFRSVSINATPEYRGFIFFWDITITPPSNDATIKIFYTPHKNHLAGIKGLDIKH